MIVRKHTTAFLFPAAIVITLAVVLGFPSARIMHADSEAAKGAPSPSATETEGKADTEEAKPAYVKISTEEEARFGVAVATAEPGRLAMTIKLPGEVRMNADRVARVSPRVAGIVAEVKKNLGDTVRAGEVMAAIESKDLAVTKAACLAAQERIGLAQSTYAREKDLWEKKISAEQDYLAAKQALAEANIELRSAQQQLRAIGLSKKDLEKITSQSEDALTRYEIAAPIDGTVIEKHVVLGESLQADAVAFVVADLSTVWADFSVSPKDIASVHVGQEVAISTSDEAAGVTGTIAYVGPMVEQDTRAALARVVLPNDQRTWKPGMFVTGQAAYSDVEIPVLIPKTALQTIAGKPNVFVKTDKGFLASPVVLGRGSDAQVEVLSGLQAGQTYAAAGTFIFKAELEKAKEGAE